MFLFQERFDIHAIQQSIKQLFREPSIEYQAIGGRYTMSRASVRPVLFRIDIFAHNHNSRTLPYFTVDRTIINTAYALYQSHGHSHSVAN